MKDTDDWSIDKTSFNEVIKIFGDVDFDPFANNINKKLRILIPNFIVQRLVVSMLLLKIGLIAIQIGCAHRLV